MVTRVLVPMDGSEMAERALEYALEMHPDAEITVLHVVGEPTGMMGGVTSLAVEADFEQAVRERSQPVFERACEIARSDDADITTEVEAGKPGREIVDQAEEFDCVVIGSHSSTLVSRLLVGNVAEKVFRQSPVPVTVVR